MVFIDSNRAIDNLTVIREFKKFKVAFNDAKLIWYPRIRRTSLSFNPVIFIDSLFLFVLTSFKVLMCTELGNSSDIARAVENTKLVFNLILSTTYVAFVLFLFKLLSSFIFVMNYLIVQDFFAQLLQSA